MSAEKVSFLDIFFLFVYGLVIPVKNIVSSDHVNKNLLTISTAAFDYMWFVLIEKILFSDLCGFWSIVFHDALQIGI